MPNGPQHRIQTNRQDQHSKPQNLAMNLYNNMRNCIYSRRQGLHADHAQFLRRWCMISGATLTGLDLQRRLLSEMVTKITACSHLHEDVKAQSCSPRLEVAFAAKSISHLTLPAWLPCRLERLSGRRCRLGRLENLRNRGVHTHSGSISLVLFSNRFSAFRIIDFSSKLFRKRPSVRS